MIFRKRREGWLGGGAGETTGRWRGWGGGGCAGGTAGGRGRRGRGQTGPGRDPFRKHSKQLITRRRGQKRPVYNRKKKWAALRAQPNARQALRDEHAEIRIVETQEPLSDMYVLMSPLKRKK